VELEGLFGNLKLEENAVYRYLASLVKPFFGAEINLTLAISLFCLVISQMQPVFPKKVAERSSPENSPIFFANCRI
jgi:hypothetical protein